jgi:hypothetical protein
MLLSGLLSDTLIFNSPTTTAGINERLNGWGVGICTKQSTGGETVQFYGKLVQAGQESDAGSGVILSALI